MAFPSSTIRKTRPLGSSNRFRPKKPETRKRCNTTPTMPARWSTDSRPRLAKGSASIAWSCCSPTALASATLSCFPRCGLNRAFSTQHRSTEDTESTEEGKQKVFRSGRSNFGRQSKHVSFVSTPFLGFLCELRVLRASVLGFDFHWQDQFMSKSPEIIWQPSKERMTRSNISAFIKLVNKRWQAGVSDSDALYDWSVGQPEQFWTSVWDFCGVIADSRGGRVLVDRGEMPGAQWFPRAARKFAETLQATRVDGNGIGV